MYLQNWLQSRYAIWFILTAVLSMLLYNLGGWGVLETSEARYAEISREMLASGNWLHPRLLGILHYHKPPLTYIISAAGMAVFGVNEFGVRFFLQVSLVLQAWLVYKVGLELFKHRKPAILAVIAYISMPAVLISARNLTTDAYLATFELLAIWSWICYRNRNSTGWLYLYFIAMALAFLTKGPVGILFPVLVAVAYKPTSNPLPGRTRHLITTLMLFLLLSASWYVYLMIQDKQFLDYFLFKHTVNRFANPETFGRSQPWWFYLVLAPVLSMPWSILAAFNFAVFKQMPKMHRRLLLVWLFVPLAFFSLSSSKLILYILPLFAGLALVTGYTLSSMSIDKLKKISLYTLVYFATLAFALLAAPLVNTGLKTSLWLQLFPACMLVGLGIIFVSIKHSAPQIILSTLWFTLLLVAYSTHLLGLNPDRTNSSERISNFLLQNRLANKTILVYDELLPSLAFELEKSIVTLQDNNSKLTRETQFEKNTEWHQHYLQLQNTQDITRLRKLVQQQIVVLSKDELPTERAWMIEALEHKKQVGKWWVYY